ncbi:hypothetical protein ACLOJK_009767 [Asimina triloba]
MVEMGLPKKMLLAVGFGIQTHCCRPYPLLELMKEADTVAGEISWVTIIGPIEEEEAMKSAYLRCSFGRLGSAGSEKPITNGDKTLPDLLGKIKLSAGDEDGGVWIISLSSSF